MKNSKPKLGPLLIVDAHPVSQQPITAGLRPSPLAAKTSKREGNSTREEHLCSI